MCNRLEDDTSAGYMGAKRTCARKCPVRVLLLGRQYQPVFESRPKGTLHLLAIFPVTYMSEASVCYRGIGCQANYPSRA